MSKKDGVLSEPEVNSIIKKMFNLKELSGYHENNQPGYGGFPTYVLNLEELSNRQLDVVFIAQTKGGLAETKEVYSKAEIITENLRSIYETAPLIFKSKSIRNKLGNGINMRSDGRFEKKINGISESVLKTSLEEVIQFTSIITTAYLEELNEITIRVADVEDRYPPEYIRSWLRNK